jgi:NAD(P)-dependent dehydrogenase (short-subunit alcohol dehydrogenase family)
MVWIARFLYQQLFFRLPVPVADFSGQNVIVTGSNIGLGLEAARHIVRLGASKVILAVRNVEKGHAAAKDILQSENVASSVIEVWKVDLADPASIVEFGKRVQNLDRLDAVIQNAGILTQKFTLIGENESHIAVNVIGSILVGLVCLPKLQETGRDLGLDTRLNFVGSDTVYIAKFDEASTNGSLLQALRQKRENMDMFNRYAVSKVLLLYAVREIANRCPVSDQSPVIIDYTSPGACDTAIFREDVSWFHAFMRATVMKLFIRSSEQGSRCLVHGVLPDLPRSMHGKFLWDQQIST